jgi:hypothetical protein
VSDIGGKRPWDGQRPAYDLAMASGCTRCGAPRGTACIQAVHNEHWATDSAAAERRPFLQTTADILRTAAAALREPMPDLAGELAVRAIRIDRFRVEADLDRRRGFVLPLGYLNQIDGAPDPVAAEAFDAWKRSRS